MKKIFSTIVLTLILGATFTACETQEKDTVGPEIKIVEPANNEIFSPGDIMDLHLEFKDHPSGIAVYQYMIYHENIDMPNSFEDEKEVALGAFVNEFPIIHKIKFPEQINSNPLATGTYVIEVKARDHENNLSVLRQNIEIVTETTED